MLARVDPNLLVTPEAPLHNVTKTTRCLMSGTLLHVMEPKIKATVLHMIPSKITLTRPSMNEAMRCDERYHIWNVMGGFVYLNLRNVFDLRRVRATPVPRGLWICDSGHPSR
jgi:hypothetical protein